MYVVSLVPSEVTFQLCLIQDLPHTLASANDVFVGFEFVHVPLCPQVPTTGNFTMTHHA